jgi:hypothetical protein
MLAPHSKSKGNGCAGVAADESDPYSTRHTLPVDGGMLTQ